MIFSPSSKIVYLFGTSSKYDGFITPMRTATGTKLKTIKLGLSPGTVAITPNGQYILVSSYQGGPRGDGAVRVVSTATDKVVKVLRVPGAQDMVITPDSRTVYVTGLNSHGDSSVYPISTATLAVGPGIPAGYLDSAIAITPNGKTVYVADRDSGTIIPIKTATNVAGFPISAGTSPVSVTVSPDGKTVYVVDQIVP
jgi:hyaluronoglucosaminidase